MTSMTLRSASFAPPAPRCAGLAAGGMAAARAPELERGVLAQANRACATASADNARLRRAAELTSWM